MKTPCDQCPWRITNHGMSRAEADAIVGAYVFRVDQYAAVSVDAAMFLLGQERGERLLADRIRCLGPAPGTVYPWNVADYLQHPDLNLPANRRK